MRILAFRSRERRYHELYHNLTTWAALAKAAGNDEAGQKAAVWQYNWLQGLVPELMRDIPPPETPESAAKRFEEEIGKPGDPKFEQIVAHDLELMDKLAEEDELDE